MILTGDGDREKTLVSIKTSLTDTRHAGATICIALLTASLALAQVDFSRMRDLALSRYGPHTAEVVDDWQATIEDMKPLSEKERLGRANDFFNSRIRWREDTDTWGQSDYWATPLEVMGSGAADCEDFAIAKYATLVLAGVDIDKLRITYVKAQRSGEAGPASIAHMVLAYYPEPSAEPLILDNLVPEVLPASRRTDLIPVYGFNSRGIWVGSASSPASTQPEARLSRWRDLLRRASEEGLG